MSLLDVKAATPDAGAFADALETLHNRTVDALSGYARLVEKADASFISTAEQFRALHATHATRLARLLAGEGREVDNDGTVLGSLAVAAVSIRGMFSAIDSDIMDTVRKAEASLRSSFEAAIKASTDPLTTGALTEMRDELNDLLFTTQDLD